LERQTTLTAAPPLGATTPVESTPTTAVYPDPSFVNHSVPIVAILQEPTSQARNVLQISGLDRLITIQS
jgi:hypothetical protein